MMKTVKEFPTMERFRAHWPITDMIQSILKTSAAKEKAKSKRSNRKVIQGQKVSQTYSMLLV